MKKVDVAIIGAGTSGLSARREVEKVTDNYVVIDDGPLGTTCARVGCMPSKVLIQVANDFYRRQSFETMGIHGSDTLSINQSQVMTHVRSLRDRFVKSVKSGMSVWENKLIRKRATFIDQNTLDIEGETIFAEKIIIATGSRPIFPKAWNDYKDFFVDTNQFFELERLPKTMAVIGLGVIGIEIGQALNRLGVKVTGITKGKGIGGLTDPHLQDYVSKKFENEFEIHYDGVDSLSRNESGQLIIHSGGKDIVVEKVLISMGRRPNIDQIGLDRIGIELNDRQIPFINENTLKVKGAPHIFLPGDVNGSRPLLHEAADEGTIAGYNAVREEQCFKRRVNLGITFSDPNIATVGKRYEELVKENKEFVFGEVSFEGQGRSIVKLKEQGLLRIYAEKNSGTLLGAELQAPDGEHLAHLIAWSMSLKLTVFEALKMPFYHPVIEEGLRTALRDAAKKIDAHSNRELYRCDDPPIR